VVTHVGGPEHKKAIELIQKEFALRIKD